MHPLSDMLIRVKNAGNAAKETVAVPYSKMKMSVAEILAREGFVGGVSRKGKKVRKNIDIALLYNKDKRPRVQGMQLLSKPSRRVYIGAKSIYSVRRGIGRLIVSTPKGIMTGEEARKEGVGGEALFKIW